jgi:hypothetical protein
MALQRDSDCAAAGGGGNRAGRQAYWRRRRREPRSRREASKQSAGRYEGRHCIATRPLAGTPGANARARARARIRCIFADDKSAWNGTLGLARASAAAAAECSMWRAHTPHARRAEAHACLARCLAHALARADRIRCGRLARDCMRMWRQCGRQARQRSRCKGEGSDGEACEPIDARRCSRSA